MPVSPHTLAAATSLFVALLAWIMAVLGFRSFQKTRNPRLVFVVIAFVTFTVKSLFVSYNVISHVVPHDAIEFISALFDLLIIVTLFLPFFVSFDGE